MIISLNCFYYFLSLLTFHFDYSHSHGFQHSCICCFGIAENISIHLYELLCFLLQISLHKTYSGKTGNVNHWFRFKLEIVEWIIQAHLLDDGNHVKLKRTHGRA